MKSYPKTALSDALMLHHSISMLKDQQQIAFAIDCVKNVSLKHMFCPTDRLFINELMETIDAVLYREEGSTDILALMIPLISEMGAELYEQTRTHAVDVKQYNRDMAASHMADAYFALSELVYAYGTKQKCISSTHDIAKNVRQASYWISGSLEREKFELVFQQRRAEKYMHGPEKPKKASAEIIPFPT